jgi:multidrug efflux pump subunit AcrA (membrane-fusion protein)
MNKRFFLPALTLLLILGLFTPWYFLYLSRERAIAQLSKEMGRPPLVGVMKVHPENKETELVLPSFLDAINITPIWARTNGYLNQWLVDIGDKVKEGDLLAFIDTPDVDQEVVQAEGDLGGAIAKESIARITADRGTNLYKHNPEAIAKEEVDQMVAAKGRLGRYKYLQGFKNLYAPFDGTIIERNIDIGSLITAGSKHSTQQIFQIAKSDILRAFVNVPQNYFHLIKDGME